MPRGPQKQKDDMSPPGDANLAVSGSKREISCRRGGEMFSVVGCTARQVCCDAWPRLFGCGFALSVICPSAIRRLDLDKYGGHHRLETDDDV